MRKHQNPIEEFLENIFKNVKVMKDKDWGRFQKVVRFDS